MAEDREPQSRWHGLMTFVQQGQVLLAIAVAGAGLLFSFNAHSQPAFGLGEQRPTGAGRMHALAAVDRPIRVISLADRYAGLPANQIELWLAALD